MIKSEYRSQNQKLREIQILLTEHPVSDSFLSPHYFSCRIPSTSACPLVSSLQPSACSSQSMVLSVFSDWSQVWRRLWESMIKDQYYDFPIKESLFSMSCLSNDNGLSWKLKHLMYAIGTGWFFNCFFFFFFFSFFLQPHPRHVDAPGQGVELELQLRPTPARQGQIWAAFVTYATAHGDAVSLTHWARPGLTPHPHRDNVRLLTHWATMGTLIVSFFSMEL